MAIPSYLHANPLMRWMAWRRVKTTGQRFKSLANEFDRPLQVMDYGCGVGVLFEHLSGLSEKVIGVDLVLEPARLNLQVQNLSNVEVLHADDLQIDAGSLDLIVAAEVLEHIEPVTPLLQRFHRMLKQDGYLLVSLPTENSFYRFGRWLAGFTGHYHHQNAQSLDRDIRNAGFKLKHMCKIPLPGPLAVYWIATYTK